MREPADADELWAAASAPTLFACSHDYLRLIGKRVTRHWDQLKHRGQPASLALLAGFTTDYLADVLRVALLRRNIAADIHSAAYGQLIGEMLLDGPALAFDPSMVIVLPTHRDLRYAPRLGASRDEAIGAAEREAEFWSDLVGKIGKPVVMLSFDTPPLRSLGELDGYSCSGLSSYARRVNQRLFETMPASVSLVDAEALNCRIGPAWHDNYLYTLSKQPFAMSALGEIADTLASAVAAKLGKARKVLVLDLDNTIWGGEVGDVGMDGLEIGPETPEGEAFSGFQRFIKSLANRGVVLAVCSKNNEEIALNAFKGHPAMVLEESDIAVFMVNFDDKATNIRAIAETLNVGLDSVVFVDDNPVERELVRRALPEVAVIEIPDNPARYGSEVEAAKLFPLGALTGEDLSRVKSYRAIATMRAAGEGSIDMDGFLRDLEPVVTIEKISDGTIDRIAQLIAKTNQFKLNATQFQPDVIRNRAQDVVALRLTDRLQDYGIVAICVTSNRPGLLYIENWVMSCRVFGRRLEHAMVELLWRTADSRGAFELALDYKPSAKNGLVPRVLESIGFRNVGTENQFKARSSQQPLEHYMTIVDNRKVL